MGESSWVGWKPLLHAPPLVFLISRSLSPGTCSHSWVSTRAFSVRIWIPVQPASGPASSPTETLGLLRFGKEKRRRLKKPKFFPITFHSLLSSRGFYFSSKLWSSSETVIVAFSLKEKKVFPCFNPVVLSRLCVFFIWVWNSTLNPRTCSCETSDVNGVFSVSFLLSRPLLLWMKYLLSRRNQRVSMRKLDRGLAETLS